MKVTINPPSSIDQVTGEEVSIPESQRVEVSGRPVTNTYGHAEADDPAFKPFDRQPVLRHRAFEEDATDQDIVDYFTNGKPPTDDEMLHIQEVYTTNNDEQLARFLTYKATGDTDQLLPQDFEVLGIEDVGEQPSEYLSVEEIDHEILATDDSNDYNPQWAEAIAGADLGDSPEMVTVQHLSAQVYSGQMTRDQAVLAASESGIPHSKLYSAYNRIRHYFS